MDRIKREGGKIKETVLGKQEATARNSSKADGTADEKSD
jgi:hypothetical protein